MFISMFIGGVNLIYIYFLAFQASETASPVAAVGPTDMIARCEVCAFIYITYISVINPQTKIWGQFDPESLINAGLH